MQRTRERTIAVVLTILAVLPVLTVVITRAGRDYLPIGDLALIDLRVRDVWSLDAPLTGPYSRFGWNHPGPLSSYLMAPISLLTGRAPWGTLVAGAIVQAGAVVAIAVLAWRARGLPLVAGTLAVVTLAYGATGPEMLLEPWNPRVAFPYMILFVLLAWLTARGSRWLLPGLVFVASLLVQAHVGYAVIVGAVAIAVVVALVRRGGGFATWRKPVLVALAVAVACWIPVAMQEIVHESNVRPMVEYFREGGPTVGLGDAAGIYGEEFRLLPPWLGGEHDVDAFTDAAVPARAAWLLVPVVLIAGASVVAVRRRDADAGVLVAIVGVASVAGVVSIARITANPTGYLFFWRVPLALLTIFAVGVTAWRAFVSRDQRAARIVMGGLAAVIAFGSVATSFRIAEAEQDGPEERVARQLLDELRERDEPRPNETVLIRYADATFLGLHAVVINELAREGNDVVVDESEAFRFGYRRTAAPDDADTIWYVVDSGHVADTLATLPGARVLASVSPLSAPEEERLRVLQQQVTEQLLRADRPDLVERLDDPLIGFAIGDLAGVDVDAVAEISALNEQVRAEGTCRCAIVAFAPADAPSPEPARD